MIEEAPEKPKVEQRIVRLMAKGCWTYKLNEPAPDRKGSMVRRIVQVNENAFRVDMEPRKDTLGDMDVEVTIAQFIVVFDAISIDIEEMQAPLIQPASFVPPDVPIGGVK